MRRIRKTRTTVETRERLTLSHLQESTQAVCPVCRETVGMLSTETAAQLLGIPVRTLFRRVEEGTVHFIEGPGGRVLICPHSLSNP